MTDETPDIPLLGGSPDTRHGENAQALLHEIVELLKGLLEKEEPGSIDLRTLPLSRQDYESLYETLGEGVISAEIQNLGVTQVRQTGVAGVWWITHYNEEGDVIGEFIEVAYCPEGLIVDVDSVQESVDALQARLMEQEYLTKRGRKG